jgi:hypothetical protein
MADLSKANIEKIEWSIIDSDVKFTMHPISRERCREVLKFRRHNMTTTDMLWITLNPVMDCGNTVYNPKALIMVILN